MNREINYRPELLRRTFALAENGRGTTSPNPLVGAVVVRDGEIVGEGWHVRAGGPHAEIEALSVAGAAANGADLYVSLEPCFQFGRTPPCKDAIIAAGISRVIVGAVDPNPKVSGKGIEALRAAGLIVRHGGVPTDFERQNEVFCRYITAGRPFVLLKAALSINGKISAAGGARTKFTGDAADNEVHRLRHEYPAVAVGVGTALIDDPLLTCRLEGHAGRQPLRIVIDSHGRLPLTSQLVRTLDQGPVLVAATARIIDEKRRGLENAGVEVLICEADNLGRVDLRDMVRRLAEREISGLLVEGGAALNETILEGGLADKLVVFVAPVILSGPETVSFLPDRAVFLRNFIIARSRMIEGELMIEAYPKGE